MATVVNSTRDTIRLCKLTKWSNYPGYGFNLTKSTAPPFTISSVDSNSPAAAANLKIKDVILEVNKKDMMKAKFTDLTGAIQKARDTSNTIELLVMEKRHYDAITKSKGKINRKEFTTCAAPTTMPAEYANFPKHRPRICLLQRKTPTESFGFEIVSGEGDMGAYIQDVKPSTPASAAGLRKSDRVIAIDDVAVETTANSTIMQQLKDAKTNLAMKFFVMDTHTYKHYKDNNLPMQPPSTQPGTTTNPSGGRGGGGYDTDDDRGRPPRGTGAYGEGRDTPPPRPGLRPNDGISALPTGGLLGTTRPDAPSTGSRRRVLRLRRDPRLGYGFRVDSSGYGDSRHRVTEVTRDSPADIQGLHVNDCIVSVNDRRVTDMTGEEFKQFLPTAGGQAEARGDPLILEVLESSSSPPGRSPSPTRPSTYRPMRTPSPTRPSTYRPMRTPSPTRPSTYRPMRTPSPTRPSTNNRYPELRQCTIRASPGQNSPGFNITQSSDAYRGANGFQIEDLQPSSPAKSANVRNYDYIIEVDDRNVESDDLGDVRDAITAAYRKRGQVKLLVIDETGYRWYKERRIRIDPRSGDAHVTKHATADSSRPPGRGGSSSDEERIGMNPVLPRHQTEIRRFGTMSSMTSTLYETDSRYEQRDRYFRRATKSPSRASSRHSRISDGERSSLTLSRASFQGSIRASERADTMSSIISSPYDVEPPDEPTDPLPRKCVLKRDSDFEGPGFRVTDRPPYDTPIIVEVAPNSPARRSGLSEADHIIYVDFENVQDIGSPSKVWRKIERRFEKRGQVTLVVLAGPAFQVLKKRGGYLVDNIFDCESQENIHMQPRLCTLEFNSYEQDYGLTFRRRNMLLVRSVQSGSSADDANIEAGDIVLELNGESTRDMSMSQVKDIVGRSEQQGELEILVIDTDGHRYSTEHGIPLNSLMPLVKTSREELDEEADNISDDSPCF